MPIPASLYLWRKAVRPGRVEAWLERIGQTVAPTQIAVIDAAGGRLSRLETYVDGESEALELVRRYGGKVIEVRPEQWQPLPATVPGKPLSIGGRLLVTGHAGELARLRDAHPDRLVLCIPAAMAFGTGEHATTAMCLRFLVGLSTRLNRAGSWSVLDLGSGSGLLALAGSMLGAAHATGLDHDRHAVRTARENAVLNGVDEVHFRQADLLRGNWPLRSIAEWSVVTANLFSELHVSLLPYMAAVMPMGGWLIASGVLASQATEVEAAIKLAGIDLVEKRRRGRWVAYLARRGR